MLALERFSYRLARLAAWLSAGILIYMVLHILFEIMLRVFFAKSTYVLDEFVAYATAAITFLCLAYSLHDDALIRVGMLLNRVGGKLRLVLELFSVAMMLIIVAMVSYYFWTKTFWRDLIRGTVSESIAEIPLWIPELFALIGLWLFGLQLFTMFMRLIVGGSPTPAGDETT
jgi:TRAP-type C4-dicarboxylate transport system permease small subunit